MMTYKQYRCAVCSQVTSHSTNHFGVIYILCKNCGNSQLECIEPEALEARKRLPVIETKLHQYYFDISKPDQRKEYQDVCAELEAKGLKVFESIDTTNSTYWEFLPDTILIDSSYVWENQWNSSAGRVFDWKEPIYPNKYIKRGYWLELNEAHAKAREPKQFKCKTFYNGLQIGEDTLYCINTGEADNRLCNKYFKQHMDIDKYKTKIELVYEEATA